MSETAPQPSPEQHATPSSTDTEEDFPVVISNTLRDLVKSKNSEIDWDDTPSPETATSTDEVGAGEVAETPESPKAPEARENLLRHHALQQNILEATVTGIEKISSIIHTAQDMKSAVHAFRLRASESRAQRRHERHTRIAETSLFASRRRKFARKAEISKSTLDIRTSLADTHDAFVDARQAMRDVKTGERRELVANNREFLSKKAIVARERRQRRRDFWESHFTLIESRQKELQEKRKRQASMVEFRQAVFANLQSDYVKAA